MAIPGLKNIPSEYRDLYEHTYEILQRLRDRQAELTVLMQDEKDSVKRAKFSKERTNINRWLGDVTQAPETFTGIELSKYTNKQLGQRVHTVARSLMDRFNIDPRKASAGGSTQHHIDSIMQMQGAYEGASIDTIFRINQSLKEEDIYLGTNAEGRNFYDVDASTHPDFHKLTPEDQVDYSNRWAKVNDMPIATPEERIARIRESSAITQDIARRAAGSPLYLGRAQAIQTAAESVQPDIVQQFGRPFDQSIVGEKKLARAQAYRGALTTFLGGGAKLEFNPQTIQEIMRFPNRLMQQVPQPIRRAAGPAAVLGAVGLYSDIAQAAEGVQTGVAATGRAEKGASVMEIAAGATGVLSATPGLQMMAIPSMVFNATAGAMRMRIARDRERERTQQVMAGEVSRYGPAVTETPTITKPESDYKRRRRARTGR